MGQNWKTGDKKKERPMAEETNTGENKSTRKDLSWIETIKENWKLKTENLRYYWLRIWGKSTKQSLVVVEELKQRSNAKSMKIKRCENENKKNKNRCDQFRLNRLPTFNHLHLFTSRLFQELERKVEEIPTMLTKKKANILEINLEWG